MTPRLEPSRHVGCGGRECHLAWLGAALAPYGLSARLLGAEGDALLRVANRTGLVRFVACLPVPGSWAFVWSRGWAYVGDPRVVRMIVEAMA